MAIHALDPVDVMPAPRARVSRIHLLHIETAVRHLRVACLARCAGIFIVPGMARNAAQPFMHSHRRAIVAGATLRSPRMCRRGGPRFRLSRSMTLVAERPA